MYNGQIGVFLVIFHRFVSFGLFIISFIIISAAVADIAAIFFLLLFPFHSKIISVEFISNGMSKKKERNHHCNGTCATHKLSARFIIKLAASHSLMTIWYAINVFDLLTPFVMLKRQQQPTPLMSWDEKTKAQRTAHRIQTATVIIITLALHLPHSIQSNPFD